MMNDKTGWVLLGVSVISAMMGSFLLGLFGNTISAEAVDWYSQEGAIIGFITPSIVFFGNYIGKHK